MAVCIYHLIILIQIICGNNETHWEYPSYLRPSSNESYGLIRLGRSLRMEFKFIYHSSLEYSNPPSMFDNVFRVGYSNQHNNNCDGAGTRYPSMWIYHDHDGDDKQSIHPYNPYLLFSISQEDDCWNQVTPNGLYPIITNNTFPPCNEHQHFMRLIYI